MSILSRLFDSQALPAGVKYKDKETNNGNTYVVYTAANRSTALEFLRQTEVKTEREYVIVETPEGNIGKDLIMIFEEGSSAKIEFGVRTPMTKLVKSRTNCTRCSYPVLPAGPAIPGATELILLGDMQKKGVGFFCSTCNTAWCPFCVPVDKLGVCELCGEQMSLFRE
jgi:hypothetical protein